MAFDLGILRERAGWDLVGVSSPTIHPDRIEYFQRWLKDKRGPQMEYLSRRSEERCNPNKYFPGVQSILCFGLYYFPGWAEGPQKFSNYSWGPDYHNVLKEKLEATIEALHQFFPSDKMKAIVDTAPALEKVLAAQAGIGWQGKNTLLINPRLGSMVFLGEIFSTIPIENFQSSIPMKDHCGTCTRCISACPTQALSPYELDASKCISYWTLEHRGDFEETTPQWSDWVAGCDICQEVCPWNSKLIPLPISNPYNGISYTDLQQPHLEALLKDKSLAYVPLENWQRNFQHIQRKS